MALLTALLALTLALVVALLVQLSGHNADTTRSALEDGLDQKAQDYYAWVRGLRNVRRADPVGAAFAGTAIFGCLALIVGLIAGLMVMASSGFADGTPPLGVLVLLVVGDVAMVVALALRILAVGTRQRPDIPEVTEE
jgi:hypothetical protein